mmetsp:Transcript_26447/g.84114  ORF Transcript_26447/g.84114 Transcript_26447/m.84114 type:complete len:231 (+) Transcript_26447:83-775(+)
MPESLGSLANNPHSVDLVCHVSVRLLVVRIAHVLAHSLRLAPSEYVLWDQSDFGRGLNLKLLGARAQNLDVLLADDHVILLHDTEEPKCFVHPLLPSQQVNVKPNGVAVHLFLAASGFLGSLEELGGFLETVRTAQGVHHDRVAQLVALAFVPLVILVEDCAGAGKAQAVAHHKQEGVDRLGVGPDPTFIHELVEHFKGLLAHVSRRKLGELALIGREESVLDLTRSSRS